jgi:hypothetical protein
MDSQVNEKAETPKKTVMVRVELPRRTHKKLKSYNLAQPKETIAKSALSLIEKALTATL